MSVTKENLEPSPEPEAPAPEAEAFSYPVPEGFEPGDLVDRLELFGAKEQFYPETMYELQRLGITYKPEDLQILYVGFSPPTPVAMANRNVWGRVIDDEFTDKAARFAMFDGRLRRTKNNAFRIGNVSGISPPGIECLVYLKPGAEAIQRNGGANIGRVATATELDPVPDNT